MVIGNLNAFGPFIMSLYRSMYKNHATLKNFANCKWQKRASESKRTDANGVVKVFDRNLLTACGGKAMPIDKAVSTI